MIRSLPCCANSGQYAAHALFVVEPSARVGDGQRHRGEALRRRVDDDHRVPFPRLARLLVADAAPEIDDLLAVVIDAARAAQLAASGEVLGERVAHRLEAAADVPFDGRAVQCGDGHNAS